jgi:hypothetical protein
VLLLLGAWWLFSGRKNENISNHGQLTHITKPKYNGTNGGATRQPNAQPGKEQVTVSIAQNVPPGKADSHLKPFFSRSAPGPRRIAGSASPIDSVSGSQFAKQELAALDSRSRASLPAVSSSVPQPDFQYIKLTPGKDVSTIKKAATRIKIPYHPQYALTVWAAPDMNSVGGFQQGKVGDNVGLLFSAQLLKRFTISTGALYSDKPYLTDFSNYHTNYNFAVQPAYVSTDCRMFDIPLNVAYTVFSKHQNSFAIGTGLSSYIMVHQGFTFNYSEPNTAGPTYYNAPGVGKYYFGILNLNATYQRQLNSRVGFSLQPYIKLPLSNVGYSQVRLQSTGIAAGLSWNFSSPVKP